VWSIASIYWRVSKVNQEFSEVDPNQDQARLIAERVARKVAGSDTRSSGQSHSTTRNGAPVRQELSAIRDGLHDLESKLERIESKIVNSPDQPGEFRRARVIDFISSAPPVKVAPRTSINNESFAALDTTDVIEDRDFTPPTQSPWLASWSSMFGQKPGRAEIASPQSGIPNPQLGSHPSQERFGVDEAAVNELVEFFENEKKCSVDPSGKPCDHCAMCSSRGF
jgi:hypothetical protein